METDVTALRERTIEKILAAQDSAGRWGYDPKQAREQPQYLYYSPNYRSTLWTLVLLADLQAPPDLPQARPALEWVCGQFYDSQHGIFRLPQESHFPIPCLNGNMLYLLHYFETARPEIVEPTVSFFAAYQRFDDGGFKTPAAYPYGSNKSCYGSHTCYWGATKLLKGLSFIPGPRRSADARRLLEACIEFVLRHEVCFGSRHPERLLHRDSGLLAFPNFYKSDFLELLWLLAREGVRDRRLERALDLLRSRRSPDGGWAADKSLNTVVSTGQKGSPNPFLTERAGAVLAFYGD